MAFCQHLRANQQTRFAALDVLKHIVQGLFARHAVAVDTQYRIFCKLFQQKLLTALRANADSIQSCAVAVWTVGRQ
jgi:hypothetical protein